MYTWRVAIPSAEGTFVSILDEGDSGPQLRQQYGKNVQNVLLLIVAWTALLGDSPLGNRKPNKTIFRFIKNLKTDLRSVVRTYSELAHAVTLSLQRSGEEVIIDPFLTAMKHTPVFPEYLHFVRTQNPQSLQYVLSFLNFGKKLYFEDSELDSVAFHKWSQVEERLSNLVLPSWVSNLREIVYLLMEGWEFDTFLPKHGNGAVAERGVRGLQSKNFKFGYNKKIDYLYNRDNNIFLPNETGNSSLPVIGQREGGVSVDFSRLKFVPKDWKTTRSICMEPIIFQWAQQGLRLGLELQISKGPLGHHVFLHDQSMNQLASEFGSKTGLVDTIDLSSASDSVSWELIKRVFPPSVLKHLAATRTEKVELPNGSVIPIRKFAPMGSGVCFPTQSILYSAIVMMVSIAHTYARNWREPNCFSGLDLQQASKEVFFGGLIPSEARLQPFRCYGDDIACDKRVTSNTIEALSSLGFEVNVSKSYLGQSAFRESCGKYHFDGRDVSPFFFKVKKIARRISIASLGGVIDHANRALQYGYACLRRHLIQFIQYYPIEGIRVKRRNPILFSNRVDDTFAIITMNPVNTHLRSARYGTDTHVGTVNEYQRDEVMSIVPRPQRKRQVSRNYDNYFYTLWWRSQYGVDGMTDKTVTTTKTDALGLGVGWRWSATPA